MNAGAIALRTFRGELAPAGIAHRLALDPLLYERIEGGEVIPEPWLRSAIASATGVPPALWGAAHELPDDLVRFDHVWPPPPHGEARLAMQRRSDGWWLRIETLEAGVSLPIDTARALSRKLSEMFGMLDGVAGSNERGETGL